MRNLLLMLLLLPAFALAQQRFQPERLRQPARYGVETAAKLKEVLVEEFHTDPKAHVFLLPNGLRSPIYQYSEAYQKLRDSIVPYRVDIVYSRYPVVNGVYKEFYELLSNRLINLFELDPELNQPEIEFRKVLQTHCESDEQVNTLFHGVAVWYRTAAEEAALHPVVETEEEKTIAGAQYGKQEVIHTIESVRSTGVLSDSLKLVLRDMQPEKQRKILREHFLKAVNITDATPLKQRSTAELQLYQRQVHTFIRMNPFGDSVVFKVMDRHPEWSNALVVNDWTGSMYGYGAQVVQWHLLNYKNSNIRYLTLFNDGDSKPSGSKVIGETGGIYSAEASDISKIINLFNLVRINGSGGDRQENDVEAILESIKRFPNHGEIILIADNLACIRDIELADKIGKPVRVLICGYDKRFGVNPHLAYLARVTGGGLYTLQEDLEHLQIEPGAAGSIRSAKDRRFVISKMNCNLNPIADLKFAKESFRTYTSVDSAAKEKKKVRQLSLTTQELQKYPTVISKMENLLVLDLSHNKIKKLPNSVRKLESLKDLNLADNQLQAMPAGLSKLKYLEQLNLSDNQVQSLSAYFPGWFYLKSLRIPRNRLSDLNGIHDLKNLQLADFSNNQIRELPVEVHQLKKLQSLDLSNNQLLYLPKTITGMTRLEELNLENNQLGSMPPYLYRLRKLKVLNLTGNPISEKDVERIRKELPNVEVLF